MKSLPRSAVAGSMPDLSPVLLFAVPLNRLGLAYMIVGSVASVAYGEIRTTNDVDFVLELTPRDAARLAVAFPISDFYCPPEEVLQIEAGRAHRGHFNLIHHATGFKGDIYLKSNDRLSEWAMKHRRLIRFEGEDLAFAPPEYVILGKLQFYQPPSGRRAASQCGRTRSSNRFRRTLISVKPQSRNRERRARRESPTSCQFKSRPTR